MSRFLRSSGKVRVKKVNFIDNKRLEFCERDIEIVDPGYITPIDKALSICKSVCLFDDNGLISWIGLRRL